MKVSFDTQAPLNDPVALTRDLIRCHSVLATEAGCFDLLESWLTTLGFRCHRFTFGPGKIPNFYAWRGRGRPRLVFAGHVDVVPPGDSSQWIAPPFAATSIDSILYGRGAVDMKGGIASFIAALASLSSLQHDHIPKDQHDVSGSIGLIITADEEGEAKYGTRSLLDHLATSWNKDNDLGRHTDSTSDNTYGFDLCITGEPTNQKFIGQHAKVGRRGSFTAKLILEGRLEHIAYADATTNILHLAGQAIAALSGYQWQDETQYFASSCLHFYDVKTSPAVSNQTPSRVEASFNIRFNPQQNPQRLETLLDSLMQSILQKNAGLSWRIDVFQTHESFIFPPGRGFTLLQQACAEICGSDLKPSTHGGTSDSRFLKNYGEVIDFGLVGTSMHQINEHVAHKDLQQLTKIYSHVISCFFQSASG